MFIIIINYILPPETLIMNINKFAGEKFLNCTSAVYL
jgi:hypothetical protein